VQWSECLCAPTLNIQVESDVVASGGTALGGGEVLGVTSIMNGVGALLRRHTGELLSALCCVRTQGS
jgi:hypothetical protein